MTPFISRNPIWIWVKVALCIVGLDLLLFRVGLFWRVTPDFGDNLSASTWTMVYWTARSLHTHRQTPDAAFVVGSSVVFTGVNEQLVNGALQRAGVPANVLRLTTFGASCTDSSLMVWNGMQLHPWLVMYGGAARDFPKSGMSDTPVIRTFYDSSAELPLLPRQGAESIMDAHMKRYWKLYRYRFFARASLLPAARDFLHWVMAPGAVFGDESGEQRQLPPEALRLFMPNRISPESFEAWEKWRQTREFRDYLTWLRVGSGFIPGPKNVGTLASYGPQGNPHVASLKWMLEFLRRAHARTVIVYFPENPIAHDPEARPYFDESLPRAYADLFAAEAASYGARFEDLRDFLKPEDFYDFIHPNLEGMRKLSARIASIIEEEWRARQHQSDAVDAP